MKRTRRISIGRSIGSIIAVALLVGLSTTAAYGDPAPGATTDTAGQETSAYGSSGKGGKPAKVSCDQKLTNKGFDCPVSVAPKNAMQNRDGTAFVDFDYSVEPGFTGQISIALVKVSDPANPETHTFTDLTGTGFIRYDLVGSASLDDRYTVEFRVGVTGGKKKSQGLSGPVTLDVTPFTSRIIAPGGKGPVGDEVPWNTPGFLVRTAQPGEELRPIYAPKSGTLVVTPQTAVYYPDPAYRGSVALYWTSTTGVGVALEWDEYMVINIVDP